MDDVLSTEMCLGQVWTEVHVYAHLEPLVEDEWIQRVDG